jgi:hypothetical protein
MEETPISECFVSRQPTPQKKSNDLLLKNENYDGFVDKIKKGIKKGKNTMR